MWLCLIRLRMELLFFSGPDILKTDSEPDGTTMFDIANRLTQSQQLILKIFNEVRDKLLYITYMYLNEKCINHSLLLIIRYCLL